MCPLGSLKYRASAIPLTEARHDYFFVPTPITRKRSTASLRPKSSSSNSWRTSISPSLLSTAGVVFRHLGSELLLRHDAGFRVFGGLDPNHESHRHISFVGRS